MILTDKNIRRLTNIYNLIVPFEEEQLQPASYDLSVGDIEIEKEESGLWEIEPGESVLISTKETVSLPNNVAGFLKDKSSYLRGGFKIGQGFVDPGFRGNLTVLFTNMSKENTLLLGEGDPLCQIVFAETKDTVEEAYNGHYQNSDGVVGKWTPVLGVGIN